MKRNAYLFVATIFLGACLEGGGGGDGDGQAEICYETSINYCGPGPWDPFGIALAFAWYGGQCTREVACSVDPPSSVADPTDFGAGVVTDQFIASNWTINETTEREPNDEIAQATPFILDKGKAFSMHGAVIDEFDPADYVVFVTDATDLVAVYLCAALDDCTLPFYQGDAVYLELYDGNGSPLQSTYMNQSSNGHDIVFTPSPGSKYYVAVRAGDTGGVDFQYKLVITD